MEKRVTIHGLPVLVKKYHKVITVEIPLDCYTHGFNYIKSLAWVLLLFDRFNFQYSWTTHDIGYYDAVENIRIELTINEKNFDEENFNKAVEASNCLPQNP